MQEEIIIFFDYNRIKLHLTTNNNGRFTSFIKYRLENKKYNV